MNNSESSIMREGRHDSNLPENSHHTSMQDQFVQDNIFQGSSMERIDCLSSFNSDGKVNLERQKREVMKEDIKPISMTHQ